MVSECLLGDVQSKKGVFHTSVGGGDFLVIVTPSSTLKDNLLYVSYTAELVMMSHYLLPI